MTRMGSTQSFLFFAIVTLLFHCSTSRPVDAGAEVQDLAFWRRQHGGVFSVLGVVAFGDGSSYPRLEIRDLQKNKDQWNVFLLGLRRFQGVDQNDRLSYFKIAGIHGMPFEAWDGVEGANGISDGYCPHRHHLFPMWHRPYLALVEEIIYLNAREALSEFPEGDLKTKYLAALATWRLPYWDWAAVPPEGESSYPACIQSPEIEIILPEGPKSVPNPLFSYTFHSLPDWSFDPNWQGSASTVRQPLMRTENYTDYKVELHTERNATTNTMSQYNETIAVTKTRMVRDPNAPSRNDVVGKNLDGNRRNIQLRVYNLLAFEHDYLKMSSEVQGPNNIENIHGTIHNTIGGNAHMWNLRYSAYDPVFWLHHSNVDRLFAIWEALNVNYTIPTWSNTAQTYTMPAGTPTNGDTPLKPFHKDESGNFWTSNQLRDTPKTFAYTYPILQNLTETDTLTRRVNQVYSPKQSADSRFEPISRRSSAIAEAVAFGGGVQYTFDVEAKQSSLAGSPSVMVYMDGQNGDVPPLFVGKTSFIQQNVAMAADADPATVRSVIPLTTALEAKIQSGELASMDSASVSSFLTQKLEWQILKADGKPLTDDEAVGFDISVTWREMQPSMSLDEFPVPKGDEQVLLRQTAVGADEGRFVWRARV